MKTGVLERIVAPIVEGFGYEFVGLQYFPQGRKSIIRLYIDKPGGVNIDDCERVSRQVNAALGVERPQEQYLLEISSPGLDRLLFSAVQCKVFLGRQIEIRLIVPREGRRNFKGKIESVEGNSVSIKVDEQIMSLLFDDIAEARLVPEW